MVWSKLEDSTTLVNEWLDKLKTGISAIRGSDELIFKSSGEAFEKSSGTSCGSLHSIPDRLGKMQNEGVSLETVETELTLRFSGTKPNNIEGRWFNLLRHLEEWSLS